ncbi:hypothetical protein V2H45_17295 [Tumidithrix elongata RA019]|uniref:Riboflavin kinase n=1 Tax=Tumidithrix elongata BACA0141 TaxID=2716417 RepID=A0AAW9Q3N1_9CYAN|nr:hypothetical protein [Tumidithrix elongata RA019]
MSDWIQVKGSVKKGHGVASGKSGDPRFPKGTIAMQKPLFAEQGLDISGYFLGTINVSIYPYRYEIEKPKYTFRDIKWAKEEPAEDFSFFDCRIILNSGEKFEGLVYYPHPETKPEHFQEPEVLEIMTPFIQDLKYEDEVVLELDRRQIEIHKS